MGAACRQQCAACAFSRHASAQSMVSQAIDETWKASASWSWPVFLAQPGGPQLMLGHVGRGALSQIHSVIQPTLSRHVCFQNDSAPAVGCLCFVSSCGGELFLSFSASRKVLAGPSVGQFLAELGADVVKASLQHTLQPAQRR